MFTVSAVAGAVIVEKGHVIEEAICFLCFCLVQLVLKTAHSCVIKHKRRALRRDARRSITVRSIDQREIKSCIHFCKRSLRACFNVIGMARCSIYQTDMAILWAVWGPAQLLLQPCCHAEHGGPAPGHYEGSGRCWQIVYGATLNLWGNCAQFSKITIWEDVIWRSMLPNSVRAKEWLVKTK